MRRSSCSMKRPATWMPSKDQTWSSQGTSTSRIRTGVGDRMPSNDRSRAKIRRTERQPGRCPNRAADNAHGKRPRSPGVRRSRMSQDDVRSVTRLCKRLKRHQFGCRSASRRARRTPIEVRRRRPSMGASAAVVQLGAGCCRPLRPQSSSGGANLVLDGGADRRAYSTLSRGAVSVRGGGQVEVDEVVGDELVGTLRLSPSTLY